MVRRRASCIGDGSWISLSSLSDWMCTKTPSRWRWLKRASAATCASMAGSPTRLPISRSWWTSWDATGRTLRFCYEAGPCGYGIQRQLTAAGHACVVVAPSLIPRKPGERIKTDRRDASNLARLHRAGELTSVWVPDPAHEAMRDLARARLAAVRALRQARQQLSGFLLRHGRHYNRPAWTLMHRRWLAGLRFEQEIHHIVLEDLIATVEAATARRDRLTRRSRWRCPAGLWLRSSEPCRLCAASPW